MASKKVAKGFKPETIQKIVKALLEMISYFLHLLQEGVKLTVALSYGNRKVGKCLNVSLAPIVTCGNCGFCKAFCYDVKACLQYENVRKARAKNTALFQFSREEFFSQLWKKMANKRTNKFLRFHVSGEIVDINHFEYMIKTAEMFPEFKIWTYTKMYWIVNEYIRLHGGNKNCIPSNFSVMYSEWKGLPIDNPYNMPVFRCIYPEEEIPNDCMECPGNCDICKASGMGCITGNSVYAHLH